MSVDPELDRLIAACRHAATRKDAAHAATDRAHAELTAAIDVEMAARKAYGDAYDTLHRYIEARP